MFIFGLAVIFLTFMTIRSYMKSTIRNLYGIVIEDTDLELKGKKIEMRLMALMEEWNVNHLNQNKKLNKEKQKILNKIKQRVDEKE